MTFTFSHTNVTLARDDEPHGPAASVPDRRLGPVPVAARQPALRAVRQHVHVPRHRLRALHRLGYPPGDAPHHRPGRRRGSGRVRSPGGAARAGPPPARQRHDRPIPRSRGDFRLRECCLRRAARARGRRVPPRLRREPRSDVHAAVQDGLRPSPAVVRRRRRTGRHTAPVALRRGDRAPQLRSADPPPRHTGPLVPDPQGTPDLRPRHGHLQAHPRRLREARADRRPARYYERRRTKRPLAGGAVRAAPRRSARRRPPVDAGPRTWPGLADHGLETREVPDSTARPGPGTAAHVGGRMARGVRLRRRRHHLRRRTAMNGCARDRSAALLLDASVIDDPYAFYRRLLAEAPVWCIPDSEIVIVSSYDAVTEVVSRVDDFSSNLHALLYRGALGTPALMPFEPGLQTLAIADPPVHTAHRGAVFPELIARRMAALRTDIEALAEEHLAKALPGPRLEVMHSLGNAIPIRVVSQLVGFQAADPALL